MTDLDKSGRTAQWTRVNLGPTLGWAMVQVKPERVISTVGTYTVGIDDGTIFVLPTGAVTLNLPSVAAWVNTNAKLYQAAVFEQAVWIKDLSGARVANPITIVPNGTDTIDGLAMNFSIMQDYQLLRLYPRASLTGWYSG